VNPAEHILRVLDHHLTGPGEIRLLGGAALILGYGLHRSTEDADLVMDTDELIALIEHAGLSEALEATNAELEPMGLYLTHIWGPEQQILLPTWRASCRPIAFDPPLLRLSATVLGPMDLVLSKLCRADDGDLADIRWLIQREGLTTERVRDALRHAVVPEAFREGYPEAVRRVEALLDE
jgi:hypothetical protein